MGDRGPKPRTTEEIFQRLAEMSVITTAGCVLWQGNLAGAGYGQISINGKNTLIHRWVYQQKIGPVFSHEVVMHSCDNPNCWALAHLSKGTDATNVADKVAKKRHMFGEKHYKSILTEAQVREIKASKESSITLGPKYGVGPTAIRTIRAGKSWAWVK